MKFAGAVLREVERGMPKIFGLMLWEKSKLRKMKKEIFNWKEALRELSVSIPQSRDGDLEYLIDGGIAAELALLLDADGYIVPNKFPFAERRHSDIDILLMSDEN